MSSESSRDLVRRFYAVLWNAWDDEAVDEILAPNFVFRGSLGVHTSGRAGWRSYRDLVRQASPDFHNEVRDVICEGCRAAARVVCTGHHAGTLLGIAASGRHFRYHVAAFFICGDGVLQEAWVLGDLESLRRQLQESDS